MARCNDLSSRRRAASDDGHVQDGVFDHLAPPYVLLEDRLTPAAPARLYRDPVAVVRCEEPAGLAEAFGRIEDGLDRGLHAAGFIAYEAGYALEPRLAARMPSPRLGPLLWFGLFEAPCLIAADALDAAFAGLGPPPPITAPEAGHDRSLHVAKVRQVLALIAAGDIYQANLTFPMRFRYDGDPLALYGALRVRQPVAHGGVAALGDISVLSVSPELWIDVSRGQATTRPMKGTAARAMPASADRAAKQALFDDPKQRAENLMIVDLLRNDLARIAAPGGVRVADLFTVETYPSFHALTSTVTARLRPGLSLRQQVEALFPCGSIVGAPKIRAGEVIRDLEGETRGVYTGALGAVAPDRDLSFNVAIRTAVITAMGEGRYGVGGGIVADSDPDAEYDEALLKAAVLDGLANDYGLIETFRWSPDGGFIRLPMHLDRLEASASQLGFKLDRAGLEQRLALRHTQWSGAEPDQRVRLLLARSGDVTLTHAVVAEQPPRPLRVGLASGELDPGDPFLRHKTTRRAIQDQAFAEAAANGLDEVLFLNRRGEVAEGSRNTVFVELDGRLVTPPLDWGVLPGVLRAALIADGRAIEGRPTLDHLRRATWFMGNSLHGFRAAELV